jgi:hypothetical protein
MAPPIWGEKAIITHRPYVYPCATPEEARQSLVVLVRRRDQGLVTTDDYLETRRRLVRAALELKADGDGNRTRRSRD